MRIIRNSCIGIIAAFTALAIRWFIDMSEYDLAIGYAVGCVTVIIGREIDNYYEKRTTRQRLQPY